MKWTKLGFIEMNKKIDWVYLFAYISICISTFLLLIYLSG